MTVVHQAILAGYHRDVEERCRFAQERFDVITGHGRDPVANPTAMAQAIAHAQEEAHWRSRSGN